MRARAQDVLARVAVVVDRAGGDDATRVGASQFGRAACLAAGFEHLPAAGAILDEAGCIVATNGAWRLFAALNGGVAATTGAGVDYLETCARAAAEGDEVARAVRAGLQEVLDDERTSFAIEYPCPSPGEDRWYLLQATSAPVAQGAGIVLLHVDVTSRKILERACADRADHDPLTGLGDRSAARDALARLVGCAEPPVSVVAFGLDGFGAVNDTFGRHVGDEVLVQVANRARRIFGEDGRVFRLGGDEFLAVCPHATTDHVARLAEAVRVRMALPFQVGTATVVIGASAGCASSAGLRSASALLAEAGAQMGQDKLARRRSARRSGAERPSRSPVGSSVVPAPPGWPTEADLRAAQATTNAVLTHATDLVLFFAEDGTILWASPASEKLFGLRPETLVGANGMDFVHIEDRERVAGDLPKISRCGDSVRTELRVRLGDHLVRWVEVIATNMLKEPDVQAVVGHVRDIADRRAAEDELRLQASLLAAAGQAMIAQDPDGTVLYWNPAAEALYGWSEAEALGRRIRDLVPPAEGWEERAEDMHAQFARRRPWEGELYVTTRSGETVPVVVTGTPVVGPRGEHTATIVVSSDNSERIERIAQAERDRRRLAEAQASAGLGSFEIDFETGEVARSDELMRILGRTASLPVDELFGSVHPDDRAAVVAAFRSVIDGADSESLTHRIVRPDGEIRWVISKTSKSTSGAHRLAGTTLDITERHLAELALAHQADHDPLTGLANRRLLMRRLEASIERNRITGRRTALLFIDLDDFKAVNDRLGHAHGDEILRGVGNLIDGVLTPGDTVARLGGDEFVVCCEGVVDADGARHTVDRIRSALTVPFKVGAESFTVAASFGVVLSHPASQADTMLRDADAAMYVAKQRGSGVEVFDEVMSEHAATRRGLIEELGDGIASGQIHTWFQPEVDLRTGTVIGFEALARWMHPERGLLGPAEFIELAEASGLIHDLGRAVLADACRELARWIDRHPDRHLTASVNVSAIQMSNPDFADDVRSAIAAAGVPPGRVCLEVTETALMDGQVAAGLLRRLKEIGVLVAIDDFGTGYSSLGRLKNLPVDFLKIDRSFVAGLGRDPQDEVIVSAVANLAHSMGIAVIAEGVESEQQLLALAGVGCEYGQGFLWSRPLPPADAVAFAARTDLLACAAAACGTSATEAEEATRGEGRSARDSIADLVHELASPLSVALGYAGMMRELPGLATHAELREAVDGIVQANEDMASIVRTLADIRPLEEGTLTLDRRLLDIVALLVEITAVSAQPERCDPIRVDGVPSALVYADPARVRQVIRNLLTNARKWQTCETWIEVAVDEDRQVVVISVFDDGPGVPAACVGNLFRRHARFDASQPGSGLGLYLSRSLARAHGGDIRYYRNGERGSEFAFDLPLAAPTTAGAGGGTAEDPIAPHDGGDARHTPV